MKYHLILVIIAVLALTVTTNAEADWVDPNDMPVPFLIKPFFAGYLHVNNDKQFYYVYHPSENNPAKDPVVIWFGSGLGCSALYSNFYSKGPFIFVPNNKDGEFMINKYNWNQKANVVFIESPGGTGFSLGPLNNSDYTLAQDNVQAILSFYAKFPDLKDQQLYLAGEGYGGVTVPWAAHRIIVYNNYPFTTPATKINLKGIFVGNPVTHPDQMDASRINIHTYEFLANHYFYTPQQWTRYKDGCLSMFRPNCSSIKAELDSLFKSTGSDSRNIYKKCINQNTGNDSVPCLDQIGIMQLLSLPKIRQAMHATLSPTHNWTVCSQDVSQNFLRDLRNSYYLYPELINNGLKIWVYSGAMDSSNPVTGTFKWIEQLRMDLNLATIKPWTTWQYKDIEAGEIWKMRGVTFLTIRSAGHMVFTDQPEIGYFMFDSYLSGTVL